MQNPYGTPDTSKRFEVQAKLNLAGTAEFTGVRHYPDDRPPTSGMRVCGIDLQFDDPGEADQFAAAAQVMAAQLHIAHDRNSIARDRISPQ
jgi:hypothetical protein